MDNNSDILNEITDNVELNNEEEINSKEQEIQNLIKLGKYDDVLKLLTNTSNNNTNEVNNLNDFNDDIIDPNEGLIPADGISLSNDSQKNDDNNNNENLQDNQSSQESLLINVYEHNYEDLLNHFEKKDETNINENNKDDKNEQNKENDLPLSSLFVGNYNKNNQNEENHFQHLEELTKELEELEKCEKEDNDNIEQMNEMYQMIIEDNLSTKLQEITRERLFPNYKKAITKYSNDIQNELFVSVQLLRHCYISSFIHKATSDKSPKFNEADIVYPKSIFDELKYTDKDYKSKVDYDMELVEYENISNKNEKKTKEKIISKGNDNKHNGNMKNLFMKYKQKLQNKDKQITINKVTVINIQSENYAIYQKKQTEDKNIIEKKIKQWINTSKALTLANIKDDDNNNNKNLEIPLNQYNSIFLDAFSLKSSSNENKTNLLKLNLSNQNLTKIPNEIISSCQQLKFLDLSNNQIEVIENLNSCNELYSLNLSKNNIQKIENISHLSFLEELILDNNYIQVIENLSKNTHLKEISLHSNEIDSIQPIEKELLYIEEINLSDNIITTIPSNLSLPYLRYLELNSNKIKSIDNFLYLPSLEKLLLKDNQIKEMNTDKTKAIFRHCPKLKEIDLSFNQIECFSFILTSLRKNPNIENIYVNNNPFIMIDRNDLFIKYIKKMFSKLKILNNDNVSKEKKGLKLLTNSIQKYTSLNNNNISSLCKEYFHMHILHSFFMKYFNSIYFLNKIYDVFNFNIHRNLNYDNVEFINRINKIYFNIKRFHLETVDSFINTKKIIDFKQNVSFLNELMLYLYDLKYKCLHIYNSMGIFRKNMTLRKLKIEKIQQMWKMIMLRKKLKEIKFIDEDKENCDDLLGFFNDERVEDEKGNEGGLLEEDKLRIEEIEKNFILLQNKKVVQNTPKQNGTHYKQMQNKNKVQQLEVIDECKNENDVEVGNSLVTSSINTLINNHNDGNSTNIISQTKKQTNQILNQQQPVKIIKDFPSNQAYLNKSINDLTKSKQLTPLRPQQNQIQNAQTSVPSNQEVAKIINNLYPTNNNNNIIKPPSNRNSLYSANSQSSTPNTDFNLSQTRYYPQVHNKYKQGDNIHLRFVNMNNQLALPNLSKNSNTIVKGGGLKHLSKQRPESNIILPSIQHNNSTNGDNLSVNDDSKSVKSSSFLPNKFNQIKGRVLPQKTIEQIRKLEEECRQTIQKAKEEWQFTNPQTAELLAKKIQKKYKKQISKLLNQF